MTQPVWKLKKARTPLEHDVVWRQWPDGCQESMLATEEAFLAWVAEGNTPEVIE